MGCQRQAVIIMHYLIPIGNLTHRPPSSAHQIKLVGRTWEELRLSCSRTLQKGGLFIYYLLFSADESVASLFLSGSLFLRRCVCFRGSETEVDLKVQRRCCKRCKPARGESSRMQP